MNVTQTHAIMAVCARMVSTHTHALVLKVSRGQTVKLVSIQFEITLITRHHYNGKFQFCLNEYNRSDGFDNTTLNRKGR
jgi:hypothetical protein